MYPNAAKGIKTIFTAHILLLITVVVVIIVAVLGLGAVVADRMGNDAGVALGIVSVLGTALAVLPVAAFFLNLFGILAAKRDEPAFYNALYALLGSIFLTLLSKIGFKTGIMNTVCTTLGNVCSMLINVFVMQGVGALGVKLNNDGVADKCQSVVKILVGAWIVNIVLNLLSGFIGDASSFTVVSIASKLKLCASVASIVAYVIFLIALKKGRDMLKAASAAPAAPAEPVI